MIGLIQVLTTISTTYLVNIVRTNLSQKHYSNILLIRLIKCFAMISRLSHYCNGPGSNLSWALSCMSPSPLSFLSVADASVQLPNTRSQVDSGSHVSLCDSYANSNTTWKCWLTNQLPIVLKASTVTNRLMICHSVGFVLSSLLVGQVYLIQIHFLLWIVSDTIKKTLLWHKAGGQFPPSLTKAITIKHELNIQAQQTCWEK